MGATVSNIPVPILTIDGPSGVGKGTVSRFVAKQLGWHYLDSGALYRILAWFALKQNFVENDIPALLDQFKPQDIIMSWHDHNNTLRIDWQGESIEEAIRTEACGQMASQLSSYPEVRDALLDIQRGYAKLPGLVTDGRDMGTVVFPQASFKVFLEGAAEERSKRRYKQLKSKCNNAKLSDVVDALKVRDKRDASRDIAPLKPAEDAYLIDTTHLSIDQVCQAVLDFVQR